MFFISSSATSTEEIWRGIGNPVYPPAREELARATGTEPEYQQLLKITHMFFLYKYNKQHNRLKHLY